MLLVNILVNISSIKYFIYYFVDKGTLDAMMVDGKEHTVELINKMFTEIERCIKNNGRYIVITLAQAHIADHIISYFQDRPGWMVRCVRDRRQSCL